MMKKNPSHGLLKAMLAVILSVTFLTGCHGSKKMSEFNVPKTFDENKTYELTFWAKNDTNKTQTEIYEKAAADFESIYPNIDINIRFYTDYGKIYNDVITNISTGTTPNICITYPDHIATYMTGENVVTELDTLIGDEKYGLGGSEIKFDGVKRDELISEYFEECRIGGSHYAMPFMRSTEACYINEDYVKALGYEVPDVLTWDYIWEVSEAAAKKNPDGTFVLNNDNVMLPFIYKSTDNMMITYLYQNNAGYSTSNGDVEMFNDTAVSFLKDITEHTASGAFSTFKLSGYPANFLCAGQCVFAIDSTAGATWMGSHAPHSDISEEKVVEFNTVVRPVPQVDVNNIKMMSQGPSVCIFNKPDDGEVLASWLFVQYLLSNDVQIAYSKTEGYVPVTSKARETDEYKTYLASPDPVEEEHYSVKIDATKLAIDNTDSTFVTPVFNGSSSLRDAAGQMVEDVVKSVRRKQTVDDDYIEKMFSDVISLYRLDEKTADASYIDEATPLPVESSVLIIAFIVIWVLIISSHIFIFIRKQREKNK